MNSEQKDIVNQIRECISDLQNLLSEYEEPPEAKTSLSRLEKCSDLNAELREFTIPEFQDFMRNIFTSRVAEQWLPSLDNINKTDMWHFFASGENGLQRPEEALPTALDHAVPIDEEVLMDIIIKYPNHNAQIIRAFRGQMNLGYVIVDMAREKIGASRLLDEAFDGDLNLFLNSNHEHLRPQLLYDILVRDARKAEQFTQEHVRECWRYVIEQGNDLPPLRVPNTEFMKELLTQYPAWANEILELSSHLLAN